MATSNNPTPGPDSPNGSGDPSGADTPASATLLALTREIEALRAQIEPLAGLAGLDVTVDEQVSELAGMVAELADSISGRHRGCAGGGSVSWLDPPDDAEGEQPLEAAQVGLMLGELVGWVERIYLRYPDAGRGLPECWLWHPAVIEELTWLRDLWEAAYHEEAASTIRAADWHDRYRPGVVRRISDYAGRCSLDQHRHPDTGAAPTAGGVGGLDELAWWWAHARHTAPPTPSQAVLAEARAAETARLRTGGRP